MEDMQTLNLLFWMLTGNLAVIFAGLLFVLIYLLKTEKDEKNLPD
jgi:hypothetical protein